MGRIIDLNLWKSLDEIQNRKLISQKMLLASLYLTSYEILKSSIIEQVHDYYQIGYQQGRGKEYNPLYETEVRSKVKDGKDILIASALWLVSMEALTEEDVESIRDVRQHRNEIAHELHEILFYSNRSVRIELIKTIRNLVYKADSWWIRNVEIQFHNSIADKPIPENEINDVFSGPVIILDLIIDHAFKTI